MVKIKSLIALCIITTIVFTCIITASAALSSNTSVYWNARETAAKSQTVGSGPASSDFYVESWIQSMSTGDFSEAIANNNGSTSATATTGYVNVTYPSPIPLIQYGGSHGYN